MATRGVTAGQVPWNRAVNSATNLVLAVAEGRGCGASAIKVYAQVDPLLLGRITIEAHRQKMAVWSHATLDPSRPGDAVAAGVDVISHADLLVWEAMAKVDPGPRGLAWRWLDEDVRSVPPDHPAIVNLLRRMKAKGILFDPTVYGYRMMQRMAREQQPQFKAVADQRARFAFNVTRLAHDMGVTVCAGTDAIIERGATPLSSLQREMETLVEECGFRPAAAIRAATLNGACALGIQETHGSLAPGKAADLVILSADPTRDIGNCRAVVGVIKAGRVIRLD
jgi:imidazolonepropionase-like amidohydrolase